MLSALAPLALACPTAAAADPAWEVIGRDAGIVTARRLGASGLWAFRGEGVVDAPLILVAAVLDDEERTVEWASQCRQARVLRRDSPMQSVIYRRNGAGVVGVDDRDMVLRRTWTVDAAHQRLTMAFSLLADAALWPPAGGSLTHVEALVGMWRLDRIDPDHTQVVYEVEVDPGGLLPLFVVKRASASLPRESLLGLRRQVRAEGHVASIARLRGSWDWRGMVP